jgi:thiamine biosynthesis lipoprotein
MAVATSGITKRMGKTENGSWHHIIDPRNGKPAKTDILTISLIADNAVKADVYAKCLVILGSDSVEALIKKLGINNVLMQYDKHEHHLRVKKIGEKWLA